MINISIATEDVLSEKVIIRLLCDSKKFNIVNRLGKRGNGYIFSNIKKLNELAKVHHVLVVTDLDNNTNKDAFINSIMRSIEIKHERLHIAIPIREIESWILSDRDGLSKYFKISKDKITPQPDLLRDPKSEIINLAQKGKNSETRRGIPAAQGSSCKMGLSYNTLLSNFVDDSWSYERARLNSESLKETIELLESL